MTDDLKIYSSILPEWLPLNGKTYIAIGILASASLSLLVLCLPSELYESVLIGGLGVVMCGFSLMAFVFCPPLGIAALVLAGLLIPFEFQTGTKTGLNLPYLLAPVLIAGWLLRMADRRREIPWVSSRTLLPLLLFLSASVLSLVVGQFPWFPTSAAPLRAQLGGLGIFLFSGGVFLLAAHQLRDVRWLQRITWLFLAAAAFHIVSSLIPDLRRLVEPLVPQGALGSLFWTWLIALAFAQAALNTRLHTGWRLALAGLVAAAICVAFLREREWASGWLPGCIAILAVVALRRPILTALLAVSVSAIAVLNLETLVHFFWTTEQQYSFMTRMEAARVLSHVISVNPLLGLGPANYYYYTPLYPILGWYVSFSSHNNYIDVLAQTGILGLVSFLWFLVELVRTALRLRRKVPEGFQLAYVYGTIGGLAGTLCAAALADWFLPFVYNVGLKGFAASILGWVFLGGLVALEQHYFQIGKRKQPITQSG